MAIKFFNAKISYDSLLLPHTNFLRFAKIKFLSYSCERTRAKLLSEFLSGEVKSLEMRIIKIIKFLQKKQFLFLLKIVAIFLIMIFFLNILIELNLISV